MTDALLCGVEFIAEERHLPDGADEVRYARIRVSTSDHRLVPAGLELDLVDVVRSRWVPSEGWHVPAECPRQS